MGKTTKEVSHEEKMADLLPGYLKVDGVEAYTKEPMVSEERNDADAIIHEQRSRYIAEQTSYLVRKERIDRLDNAGVTVEDLYEHAKDPQKIVFHLFDKPEDPIYVTAGLPTPDDAKQAIELTGPYSPTAINAHAQMAEHGPVYLLNRVEFTSTIERFSSTIKGNDSSCPLEVPVCDATLRFIVAWINSSYLMRANLPLKASDYAPGKRFSDDLTLLHPTLLTFIYRSTGVVVLDDFCAALLDEAHANHKTADVVQDIIDKWSDPTKNTLRDPPRFMPQLADIPNAYDPEITREVLANATRKYYMHINALFKCIMFEVELLKFSPKTKVDKSVIGTPLWLLQSFLTTLTNGFKMHDFYHIYCTIEDYVTPCEFMLRVRRDVGMLNPEFAME